MNNKVVSFDIKQSTIIITAIAIYNMQGLVHAGTYLKRYGMPTNTVVDLLHHYDTEIDRLMGEEP